MQPTSSPESPCVGTCTINTMVAGRSVCGGCLRTLAEIASWSSMDSEQRQQVLTLVEARKQLEVPNAPNGKKT